MDTLEPPGDGEQQDAKRKGDEDTPDQQAREETAALNSQEIAPVATAENANTETLVAEDNRGRAPSPEPENRSRARMTPAEKQMGFLTLLIFLTTAANVWVFYLESEDTSKQIKTLSDKAGGIVNSMNTALSDSRNAISKAFDANRLALESNQRQSKQALDVSIEVARNDQRAWLNIADVHLVNEPEAGKELPMAFTIQNSGKTPAVDALAKTFSGFVDGDNPSPPSWDTITANPPRKFIIFPNTASKDIPTTIAAGIVTQDVVRAYSAPLSTASVYLVVRVEYNDAFGCSHWSQACTMHKFGTPLTFFQQCLGNNGIDEGTACRMTTPTGRSSQKQVHN